MFITTVKCPKCNKKIKRKTLKLTKGKCPNCGFHIPTSLISFISARFRVRSKYRK